MSQSYAGQGRGAVMRVSEIVNTVPVRNRFESSRVEITHDGEGVAWGPGETKYLPPDYANWFVKKSTLKMDKKGKPTIQALVLVGQGKDESPLDTAAYSGPREIITRDAPTMFDADGTALRPVITTVDTIPGVDQHEQRVNSKESESALATVRVQRDRTADSVADAVERADVSDADLERAARLISSGKAREAEAAA